MIRGLLGRKLGMTQVFMQDGSLIPCTVIEVGPCPVVQVKTQERDGYEAVQVGFLPKSRGTNKPLRGHFAKHNAQPLRHLREFQATGEKAISVGEILTLEVFAEGEHVDIAGTTKGRGFAGVFKLFGFQGNLGAMGTTTSFTALGL